MVQVLGQRILALGHDLLESVNLLTDLWWESFFQPTFWGQSFFWATFWGHILLLPFTGHISVWPFLPDTFQFDLFTGHNLGWPFYRTHSIFLIDLLGSIDFFDQLLGSHSSLTFLPGTFQFFLLFGHISVWPSYRTHFSLTFLPDTS